MFPRAERQISIVLLFSVFLLLQLFDPKSAISREAAPSHLLCFYVFRYLIRAPLPPQGQGPAIRSIGSWRVRDNSIFGWDARFFSRFTSTTVRRDCRATPVMTTERFKTPREGCASCLSLPSVGFGCVRSMPSRHSRSAARIAVWRGSPWPASAWRGAERPWRRSAGRPVTFRSPPPLAAGLAHDSRVD